ncbi:transposase IS200 like protein [Oxobacter pfennigii]|uniref:Transposase IS200 like protein n=2 Tax=Oxobacter pfennigii TaxID=36849 RepID=A0A0P8X2X6_9CLOT|nr:transposase [Oxobacter pfennigii]KPU45142.1 transposase IS200 like protein [Oxobacter pfennigii]
MPRCARIKAPSCTYHIMVRSISEVLLYDDDTDKIRYLKTLKKYQEMFRFKVYAYCIMDTHAHFIIYSNGADISKVMHGVNQSYAQYYNRRHGRHGHLFQDRFKSKVVEDESYLISLSGYIHNNPIDLENYNGNIEGYPYSTLGIYLGLAQDAFGLVDHKFVLLHFGKNINLARNQYLGYIKQCISLDILSDIEFENELNDYWSQKSLYLREQTAVDVAQQMSEKIGFKKIMLSMKSNSKATEYRSLYVLFLRAFCDLKYVDICRVIGNVTQSRVSKLCSIGVDLLQSNDKYRSIMNDIFENCKTA